MPVRGQASEGRERFGEVVGHQEDVDMRFELGVSAVMVAPNGRLNKRLVHETNGRNSMTRDNPGLHDSGSLLGRPVDPLRGWVTAKLPTKCFTVGG